MPNISDYMSNGQSSASPRRESTGAAGIDNDALFSNNRTFNGHRGINAGNERLANNFVPFENDNIDRTFAGSRSGWNIGDNKYDDELSAFRAYNDAQGWGLDSFYDMDRDQYHDFMNAVGTNHYNYLTNPEYYNLSRAYDLSNDEDWNNWYDEIHGLGLMDMVANPGEGSFSDNPYEYGRAYTAIGGNNLNMGEELARYMARPDNEQDDAFNNWLAGTYGKDATVDDYARSIQAEALANMGAFGFYDDIYGDDILGTVNYLGNLVDPGADALYSLSNDDDRYAQLHQIVTDSKQVRDLPLLSKIGALMGGQAADDEVGTNFLNRDFGNATFSYYDKDGVYDEENPYTVSQAFEDSALLGRFGNYYGDKYNNEAILDYIMSQYIDSDGRYVNSAYTPEVNLEYLRRYNNF